MLFLLQAVAASQNLIKNGDFKKNNCPSSWCTSSDASKIDPWFVSSTYKTYEIDNAGVFPFTKQDITMDLNSHNTDNAAITLSQIVKTKVNSNYILSFALNLNNCGYATKTGFVSVGSKNVQPFTASTKTQMITYNFVGSGSDTINIGSTTPGTCGPVIWNITMSKISKCQRS